MYTEPHTTGRRGDRSHAELKRRLLGGEFPLNVRLAEERLGALLGVSRTPVREALKRLHAEGLVRPGPDGGYEPTAPDVGVMRALYEVRAGLEIMGIRRPRTSGRPHDLAALTALRATWQRMTGEPDGVDGPGGGAGTDGNGDGFQVGVPEADPSFVVIDESFHVELCRAAGNDELTGLLHQLNERIRLVRMQDFLTIGRVQRTVVEHLGIVESVIDGDLDEAEKRFIDHLDASVAVVEERVTRAVARMATGGQR
jgi:DNA-binding GntR family transcriptional regulator